MRLFIALLLPTEAHDAIEAVQARFSIGRPIPSENLHLTLAFLGYQSEETATELHHGLETLRSPCLDLTLSGAAVFGGRHGQAIALSADGGPELKALNDRIQSRLRGAGLTPERRRFRPHVTLARLPGRTDPGPTLRQLTGVTLGPFACMAFALFASTLRPDGAIHDELARYQLSLRPGAGG
jgi:2'-5' RNA ligase